VTDVIGALRGEWLIYDAKQGWGALEVPRPTSDGIGRAQRSRGDDHLASTFGTLRLDLLAVA
jgi:hypothetical protein